METISLIVLGLYYFLSGQTPEPPRDLMTYQINHIREVNNLPLLYENEKLMRSAHKKACDMFDKKYWEHTSPDGIEPWYFFEEENYKYRHAGENLAKNFDNDWKAVLEWEKSPTHKEIMLSKKYKEIGVGRCGPFIVTHYGAI